MENSNMKMYLVYIDESYDTTHFAYSAIFVDASKWNHYLDHLLLWRKNWLEKHQIPLDYELHATDFIGGRRRHPVNKNKQYRASLFYEAIGRIEKMEGIKIINAITNNKRQRLALFEYMVNGINRFLRAKKAAGILICDEGNERTLTAIVRKMKKANYVPSAYFGAGDRNIPLAHIIEDPLFKTSKSSYFIQMSDFLAFSLLRNEKPLEGTLAPVRDAFEQLDSVLVKVASGKDPKGKGIVRV